MNFIKKNILTTLVYIMIIIMTHILNPVAVEVVARQITLMVLLQLIAKINLQKLIVGNLMAIVVTILL